jgi:hypothetical protein
MSERYIILGPDHPNQPDQVMAWNTEWGWVLPELATSYDSRILLPGTPFPPEAQTIMDTDSGIQFPVDPSGRVGAPII